MIPPAPEVIGAGEPDLLVADEAVSALDVSVRAQIVRLFADLRDRLGLAILFLPRDQATDCRSPWLGSSRKVASICPALLPRGGATPSST